MNNNTELLQYVPLFKDILGRKVRKINSECQEIALKHQISLREYYDLKERFVELLGLDPRMVFDPIEVKQSKKLTEIFCKISEEKAGVLVSSNPPFKKVDSKKKIGLDDCLCELERNEKEEFEKQLHNLVMLISMLIKGEITKEQFFDEYCFTPLELNCLRHTLFEMFNIDPRIIFSTERLFGNGSREEALRLDLQDLGIEKKQQIAKKLDLLRNPKINKKELILEFINAKESEVRRLRIIDKYNLNNLLFNGYREHFVKKEGVHPRMLFTEYEIFNTKWLLKKLSDLGEKAPTHSDVMRDDRCYLSKDEYIDLVMLRAGLSDYKDDDNPMRAKGGESNTNVLPKTENAKIVQEVEKVTTRGRQKWKSDDEKKDQKTMIFTTKELKEKIKRYSNEARERGEIASQTGAMSEYIVKILEAHFAELEKGGE